MSPMREGRLLSMIQNRRQWLLIMVTVFVLCGGYVWLSAEPSVVTTAGLIQSPREGFLAPYFTLEQLDGDSLSLSALNGKVVVLNFWASWCPPCRAEMPALQQVYENNRDRGLEVLAVNTTYQDREEDVRAFVDEMGLNFPILLESTGNVAMRYQLHAMPSTFFIDQEGVIQRIILGGPMSETTLQTTIEELLEEAP